MSNNNSEVSLDPIDVHIAGRKVCDLAEDMQATLRGYAQVVEDSASGWQGDSRKAFHQFTEHLDARRRYLHQSITELGELTQQSAALLDAQDQRNSLALNAASPELPETAHPSVLKW
ncbi:MAG: WXG100 family type VII secretion target [Mycobacteriaceae bacterium]